MKVTLPRLELSMEDLDQLVERARPALSAREYEQLKAAVDTLGYLTQLVEDKTPPFSDCVRFCSE